ncbi:sulfate transporter [Sphaerisporangium krabiense]|uniref:MFS superfamily sulfate permease-like transporter n=1 Tax=Sphaerisporangium krabiense TaxID=763782 RepID=A0A7W9DSI2_9ACTN|nr:SulP family inorganic anion transporter [Sphaerisporangium krabiense]MBB5628465.1 MFS superfamily sulfate permease-like transporter [Sphaerisporangium krabiense]GII66796.1 sulfate transporter [Sphaerisporangium krabiense]
MSEPHRVQTHDAPPAAPGRPSPSGFPKADVKSGFLVFLIALPLCLGIALASGFPPVAGVLTAIVGGVLVSLLGSAPLTIKGPAAGLIVIALGAVQELGGGAVGYRRALAVGVVAAAVQILFALCRVATVGVAMSPSVVHGMLAAIGVIIISKQAHVALGVKPRHTDPLGLLAEIPHSLVNANPRILLLGGVALVIMFGMPLIRARWARTVPAPLIVLAVTVPLGLWFGLATPHDYRFASTVHHLGPEYLVRLPGTLLDAVAFPDFSVILTATSLKYVVMFALIGTIESTLTVIAVDSMDPLKRSSDLNRDLLALGTGNLLSALIGGLPMISEIVRSRANVDAGATSRWSNFSHGAFLLLFVALVPGLLQTIPLAVLAAMLVYTGTRLASPREFLRARRIGLDQLALFLTTLLVTLATDLLMGVAAGLALKLVLHLLRGVPVPAFLRPRAEATRTGQTLHVRIPRAAVFTTLLPLRRTVNLAGAEGPLTDVIVDVGDAAVVDHTFLAGVDTMSREWPATTLTVTGLDRLRPVSSHPHATRRRRRV